jgi:hypothetical protein
MACCAALAKIGALRFWLNPPSKRIRINGLNMSAANEPSNIGYLSLTAASIAGTCNLLSLGFLDYQTYFEMSDASILHMIQWAVFNACFYLTPLIVVIVFRRVVLITTSYAFVLFIILMGRTYYLVRLSWVGMSGVVRPFDVPDVLLIMLSVVSVAAILIWLLFRLMTVVVETITRKYS